MIRRGPVLALLLAACGFGCATTGTKYALRGFGPLTLLALELGLASVVLWAVVAVRGFRRPQRLGRVLVLGALEPALADLGQTFGLTRTSAANGALISGLECAFVVLLAAAFLRERIGRSVWVAVGVAFVGLLVLEAGDGPVVGPGVGDGLVLFGAFSAAAYTIVARGLGPEEDALSVTAVQFTVAGLISMPLAAGALATGHESLSGGVQGRFVVVAAAVGIGGYGASFLLYNYAIATVEAAPAAVIVNLIPPVGFACAVVLLGERLTSTSVVGAGLICSSVAIFAVIEAAESRGRPVVVPVRLPVPVPIPVPDQGPVLGLLQSTGWLEPYGIDVVRIHHRLVVPDYVELPSPSGQLAGSSTNTGI